MLLGLLQLTKAQAVAARCSVHFQRVTDWSNGERKPNPAHRAELERNYGIPSAAWDIAYRGTRR
jgi:hypothetical protein